MTDNSRFNSSGMFSTGKPEEMAKLEGKRSDHETDQADAADRDSGVMFSHEDGFLGGPRGMS